MYTVALRERQDALKYSVHSQKIVSYRKCKTNDGVPRVRNIELQDSVYVHSHDTLYIVGRSGLLAQMENRIQAR